MSTKYFTSIANLLLNNNFLQFSAKVFEIWFKNKIKLNDISQSNKKDLSLFLIDTGQDTVPKHKIKDNHGQSRTGGLPNFGYTPLPPHHSLFKISTFFGEDFTFTYFTTFYCIYGIMEYLNQKNMSKTFTQCNRNMS